MREAMEAQIVVADSEGRFAFRHALLREVLYDDLLPGEQAELHLALARALERMRGGHDEAWIVTGIAHHYNAAGDQPRRSRPPSKRLRPPRACRPSTRPRLSSTVRWPSGRVPDADAPPGRSSEILPRRARPLLAGDEEMGAALYEAAAGEIDEEAEPERAAKVLTARHLPVVARAGRT